LAHRAFAHGFIEVAETARGSVTAMCNLCCYSLCINAVTSAPERVTPCDKAETAEAPEQRGLEFFVLFFVLFFVRLGRMFANDRT
jgi:hypothetical protein